MEEGLETARRRPSLLGRVASNLERSAGDRDPDNILVNAIGHSPEGSTITANIADGGDTWIVSIRDAGVGIPDTEKETIFRRLGGGRSGMWSPLPRRPQEGPSPESPMIFPARS